MTDGTAQPDSGAVAGQAIAPPPGDAPAGLTASEPAAADEVTPSAEPQPAPEQTTNTRTAAQDNASVPEPDSQPPDQAAFQVPEGEPGSVVILTSGSDRGTPVIWRVLEGALGALALLWRAWFKH